jgi:hypothetical protein
MATEKDTRGATSGSTVVIGKIVRSDGNDQWRVSTNGQIRSLTIRSASTRAIDEALVIYSSAIERLANR